MRIFCSNVVQTIGNDVIHIFPFGVKEAPFVHYSLRPTFAACTIVGEQHDHGVVGEIAFIQKLQQSSDLGIGVIQHRSECFLQSTSKEFFVNGQFVPWSNAGVARRQHGVGGNNAHLDLTREPLRTMNVPAFIKPTAPLCEITVGRMMRCMLSTKSEIQKEWSVGTNRNQIANPCCRLINEVFREVIALFRRARRENMLIVLR